MLQCISIEYVLNTISLQEVEPMNLYTIVSECEK